MKYAVIGLLAVVGVVFSFQNCSKKMANEQNTQTAFSAKTELSSASPTVVEFDSREVDNSKGYSVVGTATLSVDLQSGVITKSGSNPGTFCLTAALLDELKNIVSTSQVCRFNRVNPPGTMCTMALIEPYARYINPQETFELGSASDGCQTNRIDLCEEQQVAALKAYQEKIQASYQQLTCPN